MSPTQDLVASVQAHVMCTDGNWGTSQFKRDSLTSAVVALHFVAHKNEGNVGGENGALPTNHWTLFLELVGECSFVCVEVVPNDIGRPGMVVLANTDYAWSDSTSRKVSTQAPAGTTVASILKVIIDRRRDCYIFQHIGEGCRFWISTLVSDLTETGIVPAKVEAEVKAAIPFYWPDNDEAMPVERAVAVGTFF